MIKISRKVKMNLMIVSALGSYLIFGRAISVGAVDVYRGNVFENNFDSHNSATMEIADGWSNGSMFDCTWRKSNVNFEHGNLKLSINKDINDSQTRYSAGEYRTQQFFHYGLYEVSMKPIKNDGVVSSFFTYTGPTDNSPWDEIDIEFLGKDTTKVQFNYFTNGVGDHEYVHNLGFDASQGYHTYAFDWKKDSITWYVDGKEVYRAIENIPSNPGKVMMNAWPGVGVDDWLNPFNGVTPLTAEYNFMRYTK